MSWEQILGFFTMWPSPYTTIALWAKGGVPLWQTICYVTFLTSLSLSLTFFGIEWLESWIIKNGWLSKSAIERWRILLNRGSNNLSTNGFQERMTDKIKKWLIPQRDWKILAWGFVPGIPLIPSIVVVVTSLLAIKRGFFFLIVGNTFRSTIVCCAIYWFMGLLF